MRDNNKNNNDNEKYYDGLSLDEPSLNNESIDDNEVTEEVSSGFSMDDLDVELLTDEEIDAIVQQELDQLDMLEAKKAKVEELKAKRAKTVKESRLREKEEEEYRLRSQQSMQDDFQSDEYKPNEAPGFEDTYKSEPYKSDEYKPSEAPGFEDTYKSEPYKSDEYKPGTSYQDNRASQEALYKESELRRQEDLRRAEDSRKSMEALRQNRDSYYSGDDVDAYRKKQEDFQREDSPSLNIERNSGGFAEQDFQRSEGSFGSQPGFTDKEMDKAPGFDNTIRSAGVSRPLSESSFAQTNKSFYESGSMNRDKTLMESNYKREDYSNNKSEKFTSNVSGSFQASENLVDRNRNIEQRNLTDVYGPSELPRERIDRVTQDVQRVIKPKGPSMETLASESLGGKSSDFGREHVKETESLVREGRDRGSSNIKVEHSYGKKLDNTEMGVAIRGVGKDTFSQLSGTAGSLLRQSSSGDENTAMANKAYSNVKSVTAETVSIATMMIAKKGIPSDMEGLEKVIAKERFNELRDLSHIERVDLLKVITAEKEGLISEINELKKLIKKNPKDIAELTAKLAEKREAVRGIGKKSSSIKKLHLLKGEDGNRAEKIILNKDGVWRRMKRAPMVILRALSNGATDDLTRQAVGVGGTSYTVLRKGSIVLRYIGRNAVNLIKYGGGKAISAAATTATGQAIAGSRGFKAAQTAGNKAQGVYKVVRHPIKATKRVVTKGVTKASQAAGKSVANKIKAMPKDAIVKRSVNLAGIAGRRASAIGKNFASRIGESAVGKMAALLAKAAAKIKAAGVTIGAVVGAVAGALSMIVGVMAAFVIIVILISGVIMVDYPERTVADIAEQMQIEIDTFELEVRQIKDRYKDDDRTNVVIHMDSNSLDNRREILSMTAVYFNQDFSPKGDVLGWGDVIFGDGIDNNVMKYVNKLLDYSHQIKTQSEIKKEPREEEIGRYPVNQFDNNDRELPDTMTWTHKEGSKYEYEFYDGQEQVIEESWVLWLDIFPMYKSPLYYPGELKPGSTKLEIEDGEEVWYLKQFAVKWEDRFRVEEIEIRDANDDNKKNGVTFQKEDGEYVSREIRLVDITYMNVFIDVKRFDAIFDLDRAGNLYYSDRMGMAADSIFNYLPGDNMTQDYGFVSRSGSMALGKQMWTSTDAINLIYDIIKDADEGEFDKLIEMNPDDFKAFKAKTFKHLYNMSKASDEYINTLKAILNSETGQSIQQKKHADSVGAIFDKLKDDGIKDQKVLLFYGEMMFRKGSDFKGDYKKMVKNYADGSEKGIEAANAIYQSLISKKASTKENSIVNNKFGEIISIEGLNDSLGDGGGWAYPAESYTKTSDYTTSRPEDIYNEAGELVASKGGRHLAIDLAAPIGTPIYAARDGFVEKASWLGSAADQAANRGGGWTIFLTHDGGYLTKYLHLSEMLVGYGESVRQGQLIGLMGSTGNSSGSHLHFEMLLNGQHFNPEEIYDFSVPGDIAHGSESSIGKLYNRNPEWPGWDKDNREWAKNIYIQDWADLYGLYDTGHASAEANENFQGYINRAFVEDNSISDDEIEGLIGLLPSNASSAQKNLVKGLLSGLGSIKYNQDGLPSGSGSGGASDGLSNAGLIEWAYLNIGSGVKGQWSTPSQLWLASQKIEKDSVKIGDLSFQYEEGGKVDSKIAIYVGNGKWMSMTKQGITLENNTHFEHYRSLGKFR